MNDYHCDICGELLEQSYPIIRNDFESAMWRCPRCSCCIIRPFLPREALQDFYAHSYFENSSFWLRKNRLLAYDYWRKLFAHFSPLLSDTSSVLEIGPGFGFFANLLARRIYAHVFVAEPSIQCKEYIQTHFPSVAILCDSWEDLPSTQTFDVVFALHVAEHIPDIHGFFRSIAGVLRKGGRAFLLTPNADSEAYRLLKFAWGWSAPGEHCRFLSPQIDNQYFQRFSLDRIFQCTFVPATIHYPSVWQSACQNMIAGLVSRIGAGPLLLMTRLRIELFVFRMVLRMYQSWPIRYRIVGIERWIHRIQRRFLDDELFLILEKR